VDVSDHGRAVKHQLLEISRRRQIAGLGRPATPARQLCAARGVDRRVVRQAQDVVQRVVSGRRVTVTGDPRQVHAQAGRLQPYLPLVEKVIAQITRHSELACTASFTNWNRSMIDNFLYIAGLVTA